MDWLGQRTVGSNSTHDQTIIIIIHNNISEIETILYILLALVERSSQQHNELSVPIGITTSLNLSCINISQHCSLLATQYISPTSLLILLSINDFSLLFTIRKQTF